MRQASCELKLNNNVVLVLGLWFVIQYNNSTLFHRYASVKDLIGSWCWFSLGSVYWVLGIIELGGLVWHNLVG